MSDPVAIKYVLSIANLRESMHPYQPLWIAHWMRTSSNTAWPAQESCAVHDESNEEYDDTKEEQAAIPIAEFRTAKSLSQADISKYKNTCSHGYGSLNVASPVHQYDKELVTETRRVEITDKLPMRHLKNAVPSGAEATELDSLSDCKKSRSSLNRELFTKSNFPNVTSIRSEQRSFTNFDLNQKIESTLPLDTDWVTFNRHPSMPQIDGESGYAVMDVGSRDQHSTPRILTLPTSGIECAPKEYRFDAQGISQNPGQHIIPCNSFDKTRLLVVGPFQDDIPRSASDSVLYRFKSRRPDTRSCTNRKEEKDQYNSSLACFTYAEHERCNYKSHSTFLASDVKMDGKLTAKRGGNLCSVQKDEAPKIRRRKMKNFGLLCNNGALAMSSLLDAETLCTPLDSQEGASGVVPKFSRTNHHLMVSKKTDVNLSKGEQMIIKSIGSSDFNRNAHHGIVAMPHVLCCYGDQDENLQHPGNSSYEEKVHRNAIESGSMHIQTESSAETDTMPIDVYESINSHAGLNPSPPLKDVTVERNEGTSQGAVASMSKDAGFVLAKTCLLNTNEKLPGDLGLVESINIRELSASTTESLDAENILYHVFQPKKSNFILQQHRHPGLVPSSRQVKRLRSTASDSFALNTNILKIDARPTEANKVFNRVMKSSRTSSEPMFDSCLGNGPQHLDKVVMVLRNGESSSVNSLKNQRDQIISRSWIQRWCHNRKPIMWNRPEAQVVCEPEKSKVSVDDFPRKFPRIEAMALMGKAVNNFRPCEFKRRGSSVVWNTKGFRKPHFGEVSAIEL